MTHWKLAVVLCGVAAFAIPALAQDGDAAKGETVFGRCKSCHSLQDGKNMQGPSLHGLFGRKAGSAPGFRYSDDMKKSSLIWSDETLTSYIANPKANFPNARMTFPGLKDPGQVQDVIAFLKSATK